MSKRKLSDIHILKKTENQTSYSKGDSEENLETRLIKQRYKVAASILRFPFAKRRCRILSETKQITEGNEGILYWMFRDQRLQGLQEISHDCEKLGISFHLLKGEPSLCLLDFIKHNKIGGLVLDFSPLKIFKDYVDNIIKIVPKDVPVCQVDAHNVVPCWIASEKMEYSARTIRKKLHAKLEEFLTPYPPLIEHPYLPLIKHEVTVCFLKMVISNIIQIIDWNEGEDYLGIDYNVSTGNISSGGFHAGIQMLQEFCEQRLLYYAKFRNDPTKSATSNLSPYLHFGNKYYYISIVIKFELGHISPQRCILVVQNYHSEYSESVNVFIDECLVRRELSDNFCYYNVHYDSLKGAWKWAQDTLQNHMKDKRQYIYTCKQFEDAQTHDLLWNAAQLQLLQTGRIHGFLRMYWAKKILEWTSNPQEAIEIAVYLNDRFSIDGCDPNGYVGIMWSICGVHDQGWAESPIFGKIRCMTYKGCSRKFNVNEYIQSFIPSIT